MCDNCEDTGFIKDICCTCNGSGQGGYDGSICRACDGSGVEYVPCDECEEEEEQESIVDCETDDEICFGVCCLR